MKTTKETNKLIDEKSPYLKQHAHNPVNWYPWGEKAFEKAKKEDKPIFLSIGYSTCHWCHVMAHESFEDREVAELINEVFVPVKVDREERPDVDDIYMNVCQMMIGQGGWPLTIFMTPEKKPFFAGTYIPKESKYGRMGLKKLIPKVGDLWENERNKLSSTAENITESLNNLEEETKAKPKQLDESVLKNAYVNLNNSFDNEWGGFGQAPKFPQSHRLLFLLHYWKNLENDQALHMVEKTLQKMRCGVLIILNQKHCRK